MPIKYIGRRTDFKGKTLWEILGNLKNGGVGRIVVRQMFERYPEPSYIKVLKVDAEPNEETRKVKVLVEKTFRGVRYEKPVEILSTSYKADYRLIPKEEEAEYCKLTTAPRTKAILPRTVDFPPLYKQMYLQYMESKGTPVQGDPKLELSFNESVNSHYKIADEKDAPTKEISLGVGGTTSPRLYQNIDK